MANIGTNRLKMYVNKLYSNNQVVYKVYIPEYLLNRNHSINHSNKRFKK